MYALAESEVRYLRRNPSNSPWCLVDVFWRFQNYWSDPQNVRLADVSFEALFSAGQHNTGLPLQVLGVGSIQNILFSEAAPSSLMTECQVDGCLWRAQYVPCCILGKSIEEKLLHICAAANLAMRLCWAGPDTLHVLPEVDFVSRLPSS